MALDGGEWLASRPGRFTPGTQWIGGWVGSRAGLDAVAEGKILAPPGIEPRSSRPQLDNNVISHLPIVTDAHFADTIVPRGWRNPTD
jgi:hypothetical protein